MDINDNGHPCVDMNCFCGGAHCRGNLYIQPDTVYGQNVFMITVTDTSGNEEGSLWLSQEQVSVLIKELGTLLKYVKEQK